MKRKKKLVMIISIFAALVIVIAGCNSGTDEESTLSESLTESVWESIDPADLDFVTLTYYHLNTERNQDNRLPIFERINELVKEKINAEIDFKPMWYDGFNQQYPALMAANETMDVLFISPDFGDFYGSVNKGGLRAIDDVLQRYAPKTYASMDETWWDAPKVNGKIYAVPNQQIFARQPCIMVNKEYISKYDFDTSSVSTLADMEPLMRAVKDAGETRYGSSYHQLYIQTWQDFIAPLHFEMFSGRSLGAVRKNGDFKIINQYETDEFRNHWKMLYNWRANQYGSIKDSPESGVVDTKNHFIYSVPGTWKPGIEGELSINYPELEFIRVGEPFVSTSSIVATMNAIGATTVDAARSMMFIELLNTDVEIFNTLSIGLEGVDYELVSENRIEWLPTRKYNNTVDWSYGNVYNSYFKPGQSDDVWELTDEMNRQAQVSPILGFNVDITRVRSQKANTDAIIEEYVRMLQGGVGNDSDAIIDAFLSKLKEAGAERLLEDMQRQLDEFRAE